MATKIPKGAQPERYRQQFAENLSRTRQALFANRFEFAQALTAAGLPMKKAGVAHWETGIRTPKVDQLATIAYVLGVDPQDLIPRPRGCRPRGGESESQVPENSAGVQDASDEIGETAPVGGGEHC